MFPKGQTVGPPVTSSRPLRATIGDVQEIGDIRFVRITDKTWVHVGACYRLEGIWRSAPAQHTGQFGFPALMKKR